MEKYEIHKIMTDDEAYPARLSGIPSPPKALYYKGDIGVCKERCLAVVGSRRATPYGRWAAFHVAKRAAEHGITIVSGLATGADAAAHKGALEGGGVTAAVLACGPDLCYPASNRELLKRILERGVVLSEYEPGRPPLAGQFPHRNRIISGLSEGVVVAEAGLKSGSLITAEWALAQDRDVYAIPGPINNIYSIGTNKLIQDGAMPLVVVDDILTALGISGRRRGGPGGAKLGADEQTLLKLIGEESETTLNSLCLRSGMSPGQVSAVVTILEMKGEVQTSMGRIFIAKYGM